jgi:hypothetical protein
MNTCDVRAATCLDCTAGDVGVKLLANGVGMGVDERIIR